MVDKVRVKKLGLGTIKAQKPAWQSCAGSLMAKMEQTQHCERLDCQKPPFQPFKSP